MREDTWRARGARRARRGGEPRLLPGPLRRRARRPRACSPTARCGWRSTRSAAPTGAPARRCCWATPRTPRTSRSARGPSLRWRTRSSSPSALARHAIVPRRWSSTSSSASPWWSASRRRRARAPSTSRTCRATWRYTPLQFAFNLLTRSGRIGHANLTPARPVAGAARRRLRVGRRRAGAPRRCSRRCAWARWSCATGAAVEGFDAARNGRGLVLSAALAVTGRRPRGAGLADRPGRVAGSRRARARGGRAGDARAHPRRPPRRLPAARRGRRPPAARRGVAAGLGLPDRLYAPRAGRRPSSTRPAWSGSGGVRGRRAARRGGGLRRRRGRPRERRPACLFLSPRSNRREDAYGEDGARFPLQVVEAVRAPVPWPRIWRTDWPRGCRRPRRRGRARRRAARGGRRADPRRHRPDHGVRRTSSTVVGI